MFPIHLIHRLPDRSIHKHCQNYRVSINFCQFWGLHCSLCLPPQKYSSLSHIQSTIAVFLESHSNTKANWFVFCFRKSISNYNAVRKTNDLGHITLDLEADILLYSFKNSMEHEFLCTNTVERHSLIRGNWFSFVNIPEVCKSVWEYESKGRLPCLRNRCEDCWYFSIVSVLIKRSKNYSNLKHQGNR